MLVGLAALDDAGVFALSDELALVQTLDFFTPIVDDPFDYGRIAAANSLSDVYAMGGRPVTALNIVAFPDGKLDEQALVEILRGGAEICGQAGVAVIGGHSISDSELKYGLSVTGLVHPEKMLTNNHGRPGDLLVLTKPLGTGLVANAMMKEEARDEDVEAMVSSMVLLNRDASEAALKHNAHAATDVTGFGLLGHAGEIAVSSGVTITIEAAKLPALPGALEIAASGKFFSGGENRNRAHADPRLEVGPEVSAELQRLSADPQTSGGLLIAFAPDDAEAFLDEIENGGGQAWLIGHLEEGDPGKLRLAR